MLTVLSFISAQPKNDGSPSASTSKSSDKSTPGEISVNEEKGSHSNARQPATNIVGSKHSDNASRDGSDSVDDNNATSKGNQVAKDRGPEKRGVHNLQDAVQSESDIVSQQRAEAPANDSTSHNGTVTVRIDRREENGDLQTADQSKADSLGEKDEDNAAFNASIGEHAESLAHDITEEIDLVDDQHSLDGSCGNGKQN